MNALAEAWAARRIFLDGLANTLALTALALLLVAPVSAAGAVLLVEAGPIARRVGRELLDLFRCAPFLLFAYVVYYGLPEVGLRFGAWTAGLATLAIYHAAYFMEILRSAIAVLPPDDLDAAHAFGFGTGLTYRRIVLPQVVLASAPLLGNQVIAMVKDSAFLMIITVQELTFAANAVSSRYFSPFVPFAVAMGLYWCLSLLVEAAVRRLGAMRRLRHG